VQVCAFCQMMSAKRLRLRVGLSTSQNHVPHRRVMMVTPVKINLRGLAMHQKILYAARSPNGLIYHSNVMLISSRSFPKSLSLSAQALRSRLISDLELRDGGRPQLGTDRSVMCGFSSGRGAAVIRALSGLGDGDGVRVRGGKVLANSLGSM
jgi:hypothetical protein